MDNAQAIEPEVAKVSSSQCAMKKSSERCCRTCRILTQNSQEKYQNKMKRNGGGVRAVEIRQSVKDEIKQSVKNEIRRAEPSFRRAISQQHRRDGEVSVQRRPSTFE
jgi:hypothetical protein